MTEPSYRNGRSLADVLAEADAQGDEQETPTVEPLSLVLNGGRKVTFRDPNDIAVEEWENVGPGVSGQLRLMCVTRGDFKALWREVGKLPPWRAKNLADWIANYYDEARGKGDSTS